MMTVPVQRGLRILSDFDFSFFFFGVFGYAALIRFVAALQPSENGSFKFKAEE